MTKPVESLIIKEGTKTTYKIYAFYKLWGKLYALNAARSSVEECMKWLDTHKTKRVPKSIDTWDLARLHHYNIFEEVVTRKIIERKVVGEK